MFGFISLPVDFKDMEKVIIHKDVSVAIGLVEFVCMSRRWTIPLDTSNGFGTNPCDESQNSIEIH